MDSMIMNNILLQVLVLGAFFLLFVLLPSFCMGHKLEYKKIVYNLLSAVTVGFFFIIIIVFIILGLNFMINSMKLTTEPINLVGPASLIIAVVISAIGLPWVFYYKRQKEFLDTAIENTYLIIKKIYKPKLIMNNYIREKKKTLLTFILDIFKNPLKTAAFIIGTGWGGYVRCSNGITQNFFGTSDLYVHTEWIAQMVGGNIFSNGVYPFGMHNVVLSINQIFGINLPIVIRFMGGIVGILILLSLYLLLTRLFKSDFAVAVGYIFYISSKLIVIMGYERQAFTLPQEVGMIFLYLCGVFFIDYLRSKRMQDLVLLVMAFSLTISCHFYITIFALMLLFCILLVHFKDVIKEKLLLRLITALLISTATAAAPLVLFNLAGIRWEPSMAWAASIMNSEGYDESAEDQLVIPEEAEAREESGGPRGLVDTVMFVSEVFAGNVSMEPIPQMRIFLAYMGITGLIILYALIFIIIKKQQEYAKLLLSMALYCGALVLIAFVQILDIFSLFQLGRLYIFYAYTFSFIVGGVAEIIVTPFTHVKFLRRPGDVLTFFATAYFVWNCTIWGVQMPGSTVQVQYDGAITAYYKIINYFPNLKWTIITTVDELCMIRNLGWHYEICELVYELADVKPDKKITIPGNDLFFFIEKRPIEPYRLKWNDNFGFAFQPEEPVSLEYARKDILEIKDTLGLESEIYTEHSNRKIIMSKAYFWMQEYKKYFPSEISVFYEDEDFVAYHLRQQDPYALNNLFIEYGFN